MYAAAEGKSNLGIPKAVGKEFVAASHGLTGLPARVGPKPSTREIGQKLLHKQGR
jgi:hypothetical protein